LLRNGSLEAGPTDWYTAPIDYVAIRRQEEAEAVGTRPSAHSSPYLVQLGGAKTYLYPSIHQNLVLPGDAREVTISGFLLVQSYETPDKAWDTAWLELSGGPEASPISLFKTDPLWSNQTPASSWTPFEVRVDVSSFAGMEVTFLVQARMDENTASYFFFDTLSLRVSSCQP
jgi:hypothetical protein